MVVMSAEPFYVSATFWAAAAVFATLGAGAGAIWATLRASNPKRRLSYWVGDTSLLHSTVAGSLRVSRNGVTLADPRLVRVQIVNSSRRDIASAAFDGSNSIKMGLGQPVLEILGTESDPADAALPEVTVDGSELHIGPGRIGRGQSITWLVLIEGEPTFSCRHSLIDVEVDKEEFPLFRAPAATWRERLDWLTLPVLGLGVAAVVGLLR
ncbi:hypothetical protein AB0K53_32665 [Streptomyces tuirus]|uniref:hypothetical protein n=1 Tax=Streptomyces tuirus TaxID=68278 RepID=UPI00341589F1